MNQGSDEDFGWERRKPLPGPAVAAVFRAMGTCVDSGFDDDR
jgi:hypothetical protein